MSRELRFEILKAGDGFYWRVVAANNEILAHSQTYTSKQSALGGAGVVRDHAAGAEIRDRTDEEV